MNKHCPNEQVLIAAIHSGKLTDEMKTHLKTCAHCREIAELTEQLEFFSESLPVPQLAGAPGLYHRAKSTQGDQFYRVLFPIWIVQLLLAIATIVAAFAGLFSGSHVFSRLTHWFYSLPGLTDLTGTAALVIHIGTITSLLIVVLLPLMAMGMWFWDILQERPTIHHIG